MIWEISCPQLFQNKKLQKEGHTCSEVPMTLPVVYMYIHFE